jgi:hypothetical protein
MGIKDMVSASFQVSAFYHGTTLAAQDGCERRLLTLWCGRIANRDKIQIPALA